MIETLFELKRSLTKELKDNVLAFWLKDMIDRDNGGFYGHLNNQGVLQKEAPKGLVMHSRFLWAYAAAYNHFGKEEYLEGAKHSLLFLDKYFYDIENGGYYWLTDYKGEPKEKHKQIYGQAFLLYGLSEYYIGTKSPEILQKAQDIYSVLEDNAYDPIWGGYWEALDESWNPVKNTALSDVDIDCDKSMNTNLHVLEGYTNFYRINPTAQVKLSLTRLIKNICLDIRDPQTDHMNLYFDKSWKSLKSVVSFGHDIEASWLLKEALQVLDDEDLNKTYNPIVLSMANKVLAEGWDDKEGGIYNEREGSHWDKDKIWWPQAESMVGFFNAWQMTGQPHYLEAVYKTWDFIKKNIIDHDKGEWFWGRRASGTVMDEYEKGGQWKTPYHNGRACMELIMRIKE
ncbi:AGE family epimerase/isomerase [Spirochaeta cellobiosiphila]|uniref:AGE family epimerase/isomerase n=1 Tax=Spirochaeta cellobiosiphila TaxID=504483 RepID=UPI000403A2EE|nr:AGE family epimerase/isomerase [Spirochaeta cellobiosiphila]